MTLRAEPQYVTDRDGHRTAVLLALSDYESLLEDLEDLAEIANRRSDAVLTHEEMLADLKADGLLPN